LTIKSGETKQHQKKLARKQSAKVSNVSHRNEEVSVISSQDQNKMCTSMSDIAATNAIQQAALERRAV
jgi:hypothetical protein